MIGILTAASPARIKVLRNVMAPLPPA